MRLEVVKRPVPFTYDRAATELAQCQHHLGTARESPQVDVEIFQKPNQTQPALDSGGLSSAFSGSSRKAEAALREAPE